MSLSNREIVDIFERCADMLQIRGDNIHRVLSYRRAAETIRAVPRDLRVISSEGGLTDLSYIGKTIAAKIDEMLETDQLEFYERLKAEIPEGLVDIMHINGVGPKKAKLFWQQLDITTVADLQAAAEADKLADLPGMGLKSQQKILAGIEALSRQTGRANIGDALPAAQNILDRLLELPGAQRGALAGSIRRGRETIGDVDILIASDDAAPIMDRFVDMENVARVLGHGPTKSSVELLSGLQVDVRVLEMARWGTALNYFTGSLAHNVKMRQIALEQGLSLNEHALSPVDENKTIIESAEKILCDSEEKVYETLGCNTSRRNCARIAARSKRRALVRCPGSSPGRISLPICTCTAPGAMARIRSASWRKHVSRADTSIWSSPITRAAWASPTVSASSGCWRRRKQCANSMPKWVTGFRYWLVRKWISKPMEGWIIPMKFWREWTLSSPRCILACNRNARRLHSACSMPYRIRISIWLDILRRAIPQSRSR